MLLQQPIDINKKSNYIYNIVNVTIKYVMSIDIPLVMVTNGILIYQLGICY